MTIEEQIKKARPSIKQSSVNTYLNCLQKMKHSMKLPSKLDDTKFLHNFDKVMKVINESDKITTQKNKLTCVIVALSSDDNKKQKLIDKYQKELKERNDTYNNFLKKQEKTDSQTKNWIEYKDIVKVANDLMKQVKKFKNNETFSKSEFNKFQDLILLRTHLDFPMRNNLAEMRVVNREEYDKIPKKEKNDNNYLIVENKNNKIIQLNNFKNVISIGPKSFKLSKKLNNLYEIWLKHNKSGWLIVQKTDKDNPVTSNQITKYLISIFKQYYPDKNISSSMLRHIIISYYTKNDPTLKEIEKKNNDIEDKFMHSAGVNKLYRKID
jgi:hypothetical protein